MDENAKKCAEAKDECEAMHRAMWDWWVLGDLAWKEPEKPIKPFREITKILVVRRR